MYLMGRVEIFTRFLSTVTITNYVRYKHQPGRSLLEIVKNDSEPTRL